MMPYIGCYLSLVCLEEAHDAVQPCLVQREGRDHVHIAAGLDQHHALVYGHAAVIARDENGKALLSGKGIVLVPQSIVYMI